MNNFTDIEKQSTQSNYMAKVYSWMTLALIITGAIAFYVASSESLLDVIIGNKVVFIGLLIAELVFVMALSSAINKLSFTVALLMFFIYSALNGLTLSVIFLSYELGSIFYVFLISAVMFGGMSLYGKITKKDLTSLGGYLIMGLLGTLFALIINIFLRNSFLDIILSIIVVLLFLGLTAYDTQKLKVYFEKSNLHPEEAKKYSIIGALELYLDFINIFLYLLKLFGKSK